MLTEHERAQLVKAYGREPEPVVCTLLICAAALLTVIALAMVALEIHTQEPAHLSAQTAAQSQ